jgi:hypothetical protein
MLKEVGAEKSAALGNIYLMLTYCTEYSVGGCAGWATNGSPLIMRAVWLEGRYGVEVGLGKRGCLYLTGILGLIS